MSFLLYFVVLAVALVSVVMGLDVVTTSPPLRPTTQVAAPEPIRHLPLTAEPSSRPPSPIAAPQPQTTEAPVAPRRLCGKK